MGYLRDYLFKLSRNYRLKPVNKMFNYSSFVGCVVSLPHFTLPDIGKTQQKTVFQGKGKAIRGLAPDRKTLSPYYLEAIAIASPLGSKKPYRYLYGF